MELERRTSWRETLFRGGYLRRGCQMMSVVCRRSGKSGRVKAGRFGERQAARPRNRLEWDEIVLALR